MEKLAIKRMSKMLLFIFVFTFIALESNVIAAERKIIFLLGSELASVNDKKVDLDAPVFTENGRALVPLRFISEYLDAKVTWKREENSVKITHQGEEIVFIIGASEFMKNGSPVSLVTPPVINQGRTFVPIRAIAEAFGYTLAYDRGVVAIGANDLDVDQARVELEQGYPYAVIQDDEVVQRFPREGQAVALSDQLPFSLVEYRGEVVSKNFPPYRVAFADGETVGYYVDFVAALNDAKSERDERGKKVELHYEDQVVWQSEFTLPRSHHIRGVPLIGQFPELDRGCEVTSLTMILNYRGIEADKMDLAKEVKTLPFMENGLHGNPYEGFVGSIYSFSVPGLSAYHGPIADLGRAYAGDAIADMTGITFEEMLYQISQGNPMWVIMTSTYDYLPEASWETWKTASGDVRISFRQHSVVLTGYDDQYVYMNDPFLRTTRVDREKFRLGWEQFGNQTMTVFE